MSDRYGELTVWRHDRPHPGVLRLTLDTGEPNNGVTHANHPELAAIWAAVAADEARVVLLRGTDGVFCGGGDVTFLPPLVDDPDRRASVLADIRQLVLGAIACEKPVVAAVEGFCSGAGLALALMADITVAARSTTFLDAHVLVGLACGDHAALAWPLLIGMAKASYHLLTATALDGDEAERLGLVARCVDDDVLHDEALRLAAHLADLPADGVELTKQALAGWHHLARPIFELSAALEAHSFSATGIREAIAALLPTAAAD